MIRWAMIRYEWPLHFVLCITNWLPDNILFLRLRGLLARPFFRACGSGLLLGRNVTFYNPSQLYIGSKVSIAYGCWFSLVAEIHIGDEVMFGPYCVLVSGRHTRLNGSFRYGPVKGMAVSIGRGCALGAHVTVTDNVQIGEGAQITAGAVVIRDIPSNVVAGGTPARALMAFDTDEMGADVADRSA